LPAPSGKGQPFGGKRLEQGGTVVAELIADDAVDVILDGAIRQGAALHLEIGEDELGFDERIADGLVFLLQLLSKFLAFVTGLQALLHGLKRGEDLADGDDLAVDDGGITVQQDAVAGQALGPGRAGHRDHQDQEAKSHHAGHDRAESRGDARMRIEMRRAMP